MEIKVPTTEAEFKEFADKYKADERKRQARQFAMRKAWAKGQIEEFERLKYALPRCQEILNQTFEDYLEEINK